VKRRIRRSESLRKKQGVNSTAAPGPYAAMQKSYTVKLACGKRRTEGPGRDRSTRKGKARRERYGGRSGVDGPQLRDRVKKAEEKSSGVLLGLGHQKKRKKGNQDGDKKKKHGRTG